MLNGTALLAVPDGALDAASGGANSAPMWNLDMSALGRNQLDEFNVNTQPFRCRMQRCRHRFSGRRIGKNLRASVAPDDTYIS